MFGQSASVPLVSRQGQMGAVFRDFKLPDSALDGQDQVEEKIILSCVKLKRAQNLVFIFFFGSKTSKLGCTP